MLCPRGECCLVFVLSNSKFLSVVTDDNDLPVTDSESDGDSALEE
jgi:hypothetical protein